MARDPADLVQLKLRFRETLRERLEQAAQADGQSLNSAIVSRLETSLREDQEFGSGLQAEIIRAIIGIMGSVSRSFGKPWHEDPDGWNLVHSLVPYLLTLVRPSEDRAIPRGLEMTPQVRSALADYERRYEEVRSQHYAAGTRAAELHLKENRGGLSEEEIAEREQLQVALPDFPEPDLSPEDLAIWREEKALTKLLKSAQDRAISYTMPFYRRAYEE